MASEVTVKMQTGYNRVDGSKESRTVGRVNPDATEESILNVAEQLGSLVDPAVKSLGDVKRVETSVLQKQSA